MEILYLLIPVSVILVTIAIAIFGWAIKSGQYDDLEGPAYSILYDDDADMIPGNQHASQKPNPEQQTSTTSDTSKPST